MSGNPKLRVLVVDDEAAVCKTIVTILNISGFEAIGHTNPLVALDALAAGRFDTSQFDTSQPGLWRPDVLLSDVVMPEMNGIELSLQVKILHPNCQVILFSGQATTSDLLSDAKKHGHDFTVLAKPVHPDLLMKKIRECATSTHP